MRTIILDISNEYLNKINFREEDRIIQALDCTRNCIGCFGCWIKHPKICAIKDNFSNMCELLKQSDELILISKCRYGCYSSEVKRVFERCIGYVLPYFTIRNNEIHHESRYDEKIKLKVYFYGDIKECDKIVADDLVKANAINLNVDNYEIKFFRSVKELSECIL